MLYRAGLKAILTAILFFPFLANSQVLGDETVLSTLNEPIHIEIELLDWQGVSLQQFTVGMATPGDFSAFDLQYLEIFDDFSFSLEERQGQVFILVESSDSVNEPYLDFLVRTRWPGGSVLREYIVLLDPPSVGSSLASDGDSPVSAVVSQETTSVTSPNLAQSEESEASSRPRIITPTIGNQRNSYRVQSGDTLWSIARSFHPQGSDTVLYQTLISLYDLNPDAFVARNITLLKYNHEMEIPSLQDINEYTPAEARSIYDLRAQNGQARADALRDGLPLPEFTDFPVRLVNDSIPEAVFVGGASRTEEELAPVLEPLSEGGIERPIENDSGLQLAIENAPIEAVESSFPNEAIDVDGEEYTLLETLLEDRVQEVNLLENQILSLSTELNNSQSNVDRLTEELQQAIRENNSGQLQQVTNDSSTLIFGGLSGVLGLLLLLAGIALFRMKHQLEEQREELDVYIDENALSESSSVQDDHLAEADSLDEEVAGSASMMDALNEDLYSDDIEQDEDVDQDEGEDFDSLQGESLAEGENIFSEDELNELEEGDVFEFVKELDEKNAYEPNEDESSHSANLETDLGYESAVEVDSGNVVDFKLSEVYSDGDDEVNGMESEDESDDSLEFSLPDEGLSDSEKVGSKLDDLLKDFEDDDLMAGSGGEPKEDIKK